MLDVINDTRLQAWAGQPRAFFDRATIDMDGTLVAPAGACQEGMDIAYDGAWGYHPLGLTLANTGAVLGLVNRPGNRPGHEGAAAAVDRALAVCFRGGFRQVLLRGDTDFAPTAYLDRWDDDPRVRFVFGYEAAPNLKAIAEDVPASAWQPLQRPLHGGVRALKAPSDTRASNWAYLVMTALAWNLKAWWALALPEPPGRWGGAAPRAEAGGAGAGVQGLRECLRAPAVPGAAHGPEAGGSVVGLECAPAHLLPLSGRAALLRGCDLKSE